jgi:hypothetical protein
MIGYVLVGTDLSIGDRVEVLRGGMRDSGTLCDLPFY